MASSRRRIPQRILKMEEILSQDKSQSRVVSLSGPQAKIVVSALSYAEAHGPSFYGIKGERFPNSTLDALLSETRAQVSDQSSPYTSWEDIKSDQTPTREVTLNGPQARIVQSILSHASDKGSAYFSVPEDVDTPQEMDDYNAYIADILSQL